MCMKYAKCVCVCALVLTYFIEQPQFTTFFFIFFTVTDIKKSVSFRLLCFFPQLSVCSLVSAEFGLVSL